LCFNGCAFYVFITAIGFTVVYKELISVPVTSIKIFKISALKIFKISAQRKSNKHLGN